VQTGFHTFFVVVHSGEFVFGLCLQVFVKIDICLVGVNLFDLVGEDGLLDRGGISFVP